MFIRNGGMTFRESFGLLGGIKGLGEVFDEVLEGFNSDGQSDKVVSDSEDGSSFCWD